MKALIAIVIGMVVVAGCASAPAPTPEVIVKTVEVPGPQPTPQTITQTVMVTPKVCLDALDAAEAFADIQMQIIDALIDLDYDTAMSLYGEDSDGPAFTTLDTYADLRGKCIAAAGSGS